jgi:integrase
VPHWGINEIIVLVDAARRLGRGSKKERDALLIQTIFDAALRVSEAIGLRPADIVKTNGGYRLRVVGKAGYREAAASPSLIARLQSYAYEQGLGRDQRFFPINRHRVWQIVDAAAVAGELLKPPRVGTVHILRHSGAIERMRLSGNPRSIQDQLGHASPAMTMRYWQTLNREEALKIQEMVDFTW